MTTQLTTKDLFKSTDKQKKLLPAGTTGKFLPPITILMIDFNKIHHLWSVSLVCYNTAPIFL